MRHGSWPGRIRRQQKGQSLVEAAFILPVLLLLFAGCALLVQVGLAHIIVQVAVFEAARQAHVDEGRLYNGQRVAVDICTTLSQGQTEFTRDSGRYRVTHHLKPLFPVIKEIRISHACPDYVFQTEGQPQ
ncbi:pilus assembly protein [candidate division FCPU426 bacterium]|nr:pilus assembly protein [candidate division FCPU426 bacterium]